MKSLAEMLEEKSAKAANGAWTPACGGTEVPFVTRSGRKLLYVFQASTGKHAYLDCGTDLVLSDEESSACLGFFDTMASNLL